MLMMRMADAWVRGTNPWCGWMRLFLLPLMLVPMWFGLMWAGMLLMTAWMLLPMVFSKPSGRDHWMTRACLGVQIWRSRPLDDLCSLLLVTLAGGGLVLASIMAMRQEPILLACGVITYFGLYLGFLRRCGQRLDARTRSLVEAD
jgi:hypothetical protein